MALVKGKIIIDTTDGVGNPSQADLENGETIRYNSETGKMEGTGDISDSEKLDLGNKDIYCHSVVPEATSIDMGAITMSDDGGYLRLESKVSGDTYIPVDYKIDRLLGTSTPTYDPRSVLSVKEVIQSDASQSMIGVTSYSITPTLSQDVSKVYLNFINPLTGFRAKIVSEETGKVVKYIPSRYEFNNEEGLDFGSGEQSFSIESSIAEIEGIQLTVYLYANESVDLMGDGTNPWRAIDNNVISREEVALSKDLLAIESRLETLELDLSSNIDFKGDYNATTNIPNLTISPTGVLTGDMYVVATGGSFFTKTIYIGDALISKVDDPTVESDWTILDNSKDKETIKALYESNDDTNCFTDSEKLKLSTVGEGANENVQSDWDQSNISSDDYIKNKPTITTEIYGAGYFIDEVSTYCDSSSYWYKVEADFVALKEIGLEWDSTNKRWNYTGSGGDVSIIASFSGVHSVSYTKCVKWEFRVNGSQISSPSVEKDIEAGDLGALTLIAPMVSLVNGDYIEIYTKLESSRYSVKTSNFNLLIRS